MPIVKMEERSSLTPGYEYSEVIADGETGKIIHLVDLVYSAVTCTLISGANTGKFQSTTSPDADVIADTAEWTDWHIGSYSGSISDAVAAPITGLRGVSISGEIKIEVLI
jgi:hypothetical protein